MGQNYLAHWDGCCHFEVDKYNASIMDKLLDIIQKLRDAVVPAEKLAKMSKKQILSFIEDAKILQKMRIFHEKKRAKAVKSIVNEDEEESVDLGI